MVDVKFQVTDHQLYIIFMTYSNSCLSVI